MNHPHLVAIARQVVAAIERRLPAGVREAAQGVPVCYETKPNDALCDDGVEPDVLGLFVGEEHSRASANDLHPLPPQILLFLENIWDLAEGDETVYRDEVRLTYLHELGHYFGWDEEELARRGLD